MPWSCLCAREKKPKRPDISAPILLEEKDHFKLQFLPIQRHVTPAPKNNDHKRLLPERPKDKVLINKPSNLRTPNSLRNKNELSKNNANVKFRFERKSSDHTLIEAVLDENGNGHYDYLLPLENGMPKKVQDEKLSNSVVKSTNLSPFPPSTNSAPNATSAAAIDKVRQNDDVINNNIPFIHELSEEIEPIEFKHDFIGFNCDIQQHKICQYCHRVMGVEVAVKCRSCNLIGHKKCSEYQPQKRFSDTTYIIYKQWKAGNTKTAFPTVYDYECRRQPEENNNNNEEISVYTGEKEAKDEAAESVISQNSSVRQSTTEAEEEDLIIVHPLKIEENETDDDKVEETQKLVPPAASPHRRRECPFPIEIRHKQFHIVNDDSDQSSNDEESSDDYSQIELRRKAKSNFDERKPQIDTKFNTLQLPSSNNNGTGLNLSNNKTTRSKSNNNGEFEHEPLSDEIHINYVTQRILASTLPERRSAAVSLNGRPHELAINNALPSSASAALSSPPTSADKYESELIKMLEQKHGKDYQIFDLESCLSTLTLEKLCELCKRIDAWLGSGREKIVVLQDRKDNSKLAAAIAAYMEYLKLCGSNFPRENFNEDKNAQNQIERNWLKLDIYSMQKFLDNVIGPMQTPSHKRYIQYFSGLLSGNIKMNSSPIYLKSVILESPPCLHYKAIIPNNEWKSFIRIYEGSQCVFTSDVYIIPITTRQFIYEIKSPIRLRGDITICCFQLLPNNRIFAKELVSSIQFHTCAIIHKDIMFYKNDIDLAYNDERFSNDHKIKLNFHNHNSNNNIGYNNTSNSDDLLFQNPLVRKEPLSNFDVIDEWSQTQTSVSQTEGPLDGSLYATITKSPKPSAASSSPVSPITPPQRSSSQLIISPPSEFGSAQHHSHQNSPSPSVLQQQQQQTRYYRSNSARNTPTNFSKQSYQDKLRYTSNYTPSENLSLSLTKAVGGHDPYYSPHHPDDGKESSVRSPLTLSMDSGISSSGIANRRVQNSSVSPSSFPSQASPQEDRHRELDDLLSDMLMTVQDIPDIGNSNNSNKVKNINNKQFKPIGNNSGSGGNNKHIQQSYSSVDLINQEQQLYHTTNTIKHSHSDFLTKEEIAIARATSATPTLSSAGAYGSGGGAPIQSNEVTTTPTAAATATASISTNNNSIITERDILQQYETSSTTTTLTPPASESGRETPFFNSNSNSQAYFGNGNSGNRGDQHRDQQRSSTERELIMSLQNQSYAYQQSRRSDANNTDYDDDEDSNKPYHAREDSQPFTYGNIPKSGSGSTLNSISTTTTTSHTGAGGGNMLKMHSGLSSPSMVRKALGQPSPHNNNSNKSQTLGKVTPRNEFEEMLRERREKVLSEKYSIGDKTPTNVTSANGHHYTVGKSSQFNNLNYDSDNMWSNANNSTSPTVQNGYQYESLKRSNTMDGSFGRSFSNDGISGQTWLQLQQQKLRAKKEQQRRGGGVDTVDYMFSSRDYAGSPAYSDIVQTQKRSQTMSPVRNERHYNTITNTSVTKSYNERPFVAVQRAHDQAKQNRYGSSPQNNSLSIINASPHGQIAQAQNRNGLLTVTDDHSPKNGHVRLESDSNIITSTNNSNCNGSDNNSNNHISHSATAFSDSSMIATNGDPSAAAASYRQLTLDNLLESLAIESNVAEQHLAKIDIENNNNNNNSSSISNHSISHNLSNGNRKFVRTMGNGCSQNASPNRVGTGTGHALNGKKFNDFNNNKIGSETESSSSISPSLSERSNGISWSDQAREESFSSYRSETEADLSPMGGSRPETPAFPVTPRTPYGLHNGQSSPALPPKSPTSTRKRNSNWSSFRTQKTSTTASQDYLKDFSGNQKIHEIINQNDSISCYTSRRNSTTSNANSEPQEVASHHVKFVRDSSKFWYKPDITRDEAINLLRHAPPGTFVVRDSTTFANAYGLVLKVSQPPPGVPSKGPPGDELVRHFLVEPTLRGVRLKGCVNEPVFSSLSALVYQHSITPMALPCRLILPEVDLQPIENHSPAQQQLLSQGAACNVLYLFTTDTESLTGPQAVRKAVASLFSLRPLPQATQVHFKVSKQGITLTDNTRRLFFRRHYPTNTISHCGADPDDHRWSVHIPSGDIPVTNYRIFAFVAKRSASSNDNQCHVFCELEAKQPATAIVSFANKIVLNGGGQQQAAIPRSL